MMMIILPRIMDAPDVNPLTATVLCQLGHGLIFQVKVMPIQKMTDNPSILVVKGSTLFWHVRRYE